VFLNEFADDLAPKDMRSSAEFDSLLQSASDLGIPHDASVRYVSRQAVLRGMRFHFTEWGDPSSPPVLMLHGGNQSSHSWDLVSLHLSDRYHVYALDQRGHGDTEWSRELDYSMDAMAADVLAFIADQELVRPIIFGHSMGGRVTLQAVLQEPSVARALVVVDVGPELSAKGAKVIGEFVAHNIEFDDLDVFLENVARYDRFRSREHIARTVKYNLLVRADGKYVSKVDHRRLPGAMREMTLTSVAAIDCPALVVRGGESDVLLADAADRFVRALRDGRLVTVPDVGHNVHGGNTPGFLAAIGPFLASLDS
jgi:pimeloyl-ACP methyl ester carboxylesterase